MGKRKTLVAMYGKRYYRIRLRMLFWGFLLFFSVALLIVLFVEGCLMDKTSVPMELSQVDSVGDHVILHVTNIDYLFASRDGSKREVCLINSGGRAVVAYITDGDLETYTERLKKEKVIDITGVTDNPSSLILDDFGKIGLKIDYKTFMSRYGK